MIQSNSVYRYFDAHGVMVYVGITHHGLVRNRQHNAEKAWWVFVHRQEVEHYDSREAAHAREIELIQRHRPPFNVMHNHQHTEVREAYIQLQQSGRLGKSAQELMSDGTKKHLNITGLAKTSTSARFGTQFHDGPICQGLTLRRQAGVFDGANGCRVGRVLGVVSGLSLRLRQGSTCGCEHR